MGVSDEEARATSSSVGEGVAKTEVAAARTVKVEKVFMAMIRKVDG
jgi:hypothetical protein